MFYSCSDRISSSRTKAKSDSMEPTIKAGSFFEWEPLTDEMVIERGDLVVIIAPNDGRAFWARRIVGLGGESLTIGDKGIEFDGRILKWIDIIEGFDLKDVGLTGSFTIPKGNFFYIGDNLRNARDSREFGCISRDKIVGKITKLEKMPSIQ